MIVTQCGMCNAHELYRIIEAIKHEVIFDTAYCDIKKIK